MLVVRAIFVKIDIDGVGTWAYTVWRWVQGGFPAGTRVSR